MLSLTSVLALATFLVVSAARDGAAPVVEKLGTADLSMVETTPVFWKGDLLRFESVRTDYNGFTPRCDPATCGVPAGVR